MKGSFWWSILRLLDTCKGISQKQLGSGDTILFWSDLWNGRVLKLSYPHLFSFATNENITIKAVIEKEDLQSVFSSITPI
jgi:hypothetical protein